MTRLCEFCGGELDQFGGCSCVVNVVNLTPDVISVDGFTIEPSGAVATVEGTPEDISFVPTIFGAIPLYKKSFGVLEGLPDPQERTIFIVREEVAQAAWAQGRQDVVCPGGPVRDAQGELLGYDGLMQNPL